MISLKLILSKFLVFAVPTVTSKLSDFDGKQLSSAKGGGGDIATWYQAWEPYLHYRMEIINSVFGWIAGAFVKGIYNLNQGIYNIFSAMFSLLGWDGTLTASSSPLHGFYVTITIIGWAMLGFAIVVVVWQSLGHAVKWGKILPNIMLVALTLTVLPLMMRTTGSAASAGTNNPGLGDVVVSAKNDVDKSSDGSTSTSDIAAAPIHNNVVDLARVASKNWNFDPGSLDIAKTNTFNDSAHIRGLNIGQTMDSDTFKEFGLDKKGSDKIGFDKMQDPLNYSFDDNPGDDNLATVYLLSKRDVPTGLGKANDWGYARYSVNWVPLIGQSIILWVVLMIAAFRVTKDIFELTLMNLVAPLTAYQNVHSSKKLRDLINSIIGLMMSIVLLFLVVRVFFIFIGAAPSKLPSSLNGVQKGIATMIIYAAGGYAMFAGISYFERVTGTSQGLTDETGHMGATMMGAYGAARMGQMAMGAAGKGISHLHNAHSQNSTALPGNSSASGVSTNTANATHTNNTQGGSSNLQSNQNEQSNGLHDEKSMADSQTNANNTNEQQDTQNQDQQNSSLNNSNQTQNGTTQNDSQNNSQNNLADTNAGGLSQSGEGAENHNESNDYGANNLHQEEMNNSDIHSGTDHALNDTNPNLQDQDSNGLNNSIESDSSNSNLNSGSSDNINENLKDPGNDGPSSQSELNSANTGLDSDVGNDTSIPNQSSEDSGLSDGNYDDKNQFDGNTSNDNENNGVSFERLGANGVNGSTDSENSLNYGGSASDSYSEPHDSPTGTDSSEGGKEAPASTFEKLSSHAYKSGKQGVSGSTNYLRSRNMGMSQRGHSNGIDADDIDE